LLIAEYCRNHSAICFVEQDYIQ